MFTVFRKMSRDVEQLKQTIRGTITPYRILNMHDDKCIRKMGRDSTLSILMRDWNLMSKKCLLFEIEKGKTDCRNLGRRQGIDMKTDDRFATDFKVINNSLICTMITSNPIKINKILDFCLCHLIL